MYFTVVNIGLPVDAHIHKDNHIHIFSAEDHLAILQNPRNFLNKRLRALAVAVDQ